MEGKVIFGTFEDVAFTDVSGEKISEVKTIAKIDTGAFSGVIHADNICEKNGILSFNLAGDKRMHFETQDYLTRKVKNTHGGSKTRYLVKFKILIEGREFEALFGLDDRSKMKFEMLIGRAFLIKNNILVDSCRKIDLDEEWKLMGEKQ